MKVSSNSNSVLPILRRRGILSLFAATIFFVLAIVLPISINRRRSTAQDETAVVDDESIDMVAGVTITPSSPTLSILPEIDDDGALSNSREETRIDFDDAVSNSREDRIYSYLRPTNTPTNPPSRPSASGQSMSLSEVTSSVQSGQPNSQPSQEPTSQPSKAPTGPPSDSPSNFPSDSPSLRPSDGFNITFIPGLLTHMENGLLLSAGLTARLVAETGAQVAYTDGTYSSIRFHGMPDFGACFVDDRPKNAGGWVYVSNSEMKEKGEGGVGAITFNAAGEVLNYEMVLSGTTMNCGGGKSPWNTWLSCEETNGGQVYQVDPMGRRQASPITLGSEGGHWESFAADTSNRDVPRFFVTEDAPRGALQRFTPHNVSWDPDEAWKMLHGPGTIEYLMMRPGSSGTDSGTFWWGSDRGSARNNAAKYYPNSEGIDVYNSKLYFVCKRIKRLFELDLIEGTYTNQTTTHGLFNGGPDQLKRLLADGSDDLLFFTEEGGGDAGIHGRDATGLFFTLLESPKYVDETTGLAFSPDARHLYVAWQKNGLLFDITRTDGFPFHARSLNVKYHAVE